ncbi:hypothetical protein ABW19_dt0207980 [Dactylella cylindrospora]|nr:hypothetical protein ABW19_dt0207980 [Dactylella cylindrospora]
MAITTLPLPVELLYEVFESCERRDVINFASTSRASYISCLRLLLSKYDLPFSLPFLASEEMAVRLGPRSNPVRDRIEYVSIDISKKVWSDADLASRCLSEFEKSLLSLKIKKLRICTSQGGCDISAFLKIFEIICTNGFPGAYKLMIRISVDREDEAALISGVAALVAKLRAPQSYAPPFHLQSLYIIITAFNARTTMQAVIDLIGEFITPDFENLKIVIKWKEGSYYGSSDIPDKRLRLDQLHSEKLDDLYFEDKSWGYLYDVISACTTNWPNMNALHIDCGLGYTAEHYAGLGLLQDLRSLSIPYPYYSFTSEIGCCMQREFENVVRWKFDRKLMVRLDEVNCHFLRPSGEHTDFIKVATKKESASYSEDEEDEDEEGDEGYFRFLAIETEVQNIRRERSDPTDLAVMREMLLDESSRRPFLKHWSPSWELLSGYMAPFIRQMLSNGDSLENYIKEDVEKEQDWDSPCEYCEKPEETSEQIDNNYEGNENDGA